jgi:predicted NBD/HSP70 family sugar kinase
MIQKEIVLGVDIGGTNTGFGYVDREGNLLAEAVMAMDIQNKLGKNTNRK